MRKIVLGLATLVGLTSLPGSTDAGERQFLFFRWDNGRASQVQQYEPAPQYEYAQPQYSQQPAYIDEQAPSRPNAFGQIMEMERRKNAWLRRTFFGQ